MSRDLLEDIIRTINFFFWLVVAMLAVFFILFSITEQAKADTDEFSRHNCGITPGSDACRGIERQPLISTVPPQTNPQSSRTCVVVGAQLYCATTTYQP